MLDHHDVHPTAVCDGPVPVPGVHVGAFACVGAGVRFARGVRVASHAVLEGGVVLGENVRIGPGTRVGAGTCLEDSVELGSSVIIDASADRPASIIRSGTSIGAGAILGGGLIVGPNARVEPGAVVLRSVPPNAIVSGHPAQIVGYVDTVGRGPAVPASIQPGVRTTSINGVTLHQMREIDDLRGNLSVGELGRDVPFEVKRYFLVYGVPNLEIRGEHAHRECHQFLIAVKGSIHVVADDGRSREEFVLNRPSLGLHLPPMVWGIQYRYSPDAVLLVLASHHYDAADYVRDHDQFLALVATRAHVPDA